MQDYYNGFVHYRTLHNNEEVHLVTMGKNTLYICMYMYICVSVINE